MQEAIVALGHHVASVHAQARHLEGCPYRVAGEELVVGGDAGELDHAELQDHVVDELLGLGLGELASLEVALDVDVQEGRDAAYGHGGAVLGLDGSKIAKVEPLHGLVSVLGGRGDVKAVNLGHLLHALQGADLIGDLLPQADDVIGHGAVAAVEKILLLLGDQEVDAVEGHPAVVAHDAAASVGIRKPRHDVGVAGGAHLGGICIEDGLVVRLMVLAEDLVVLVVDVVAVVLGCLLRHLDAAIGHEGALEGLVGLQADHLLKLLHRLVDVPRAVGREARHDLGLAIENTVMLALLGLELLQATPELVSRLGGAGEEALVALVLGVVVLDEVAHVDIIHPVAAGKAVPCLLHLIPPWYKVLTRRVSCALQDPLRISHSLDRWGLGVPQGVRNA